MVVLQFFCDSERDAGGGLGGSKWQFQRDVIIEKPLNKYRMSLQIFSRKF